MPRLLQRIALDFGEFELRLGVQDGDEIFSERHVDLFSKFIGRRHVLFFEKKKKIPTFSSIYEHGLIRDPKLLSEYLRFVFLEVGVTHHPFARLEVYVNIGSKTATTTKQLWVQSLELLGVSKVTFVANALSCAVGAGFSFPIPSFALLIHLGYSSSEVAGVAFTRCLFSNPLECSGERIRSTLEAEIFRVYGRELTQGFWEKLLSNLGGFLPQDQKTPRSEDYQAFIDEVTLTMQIPEEFLREKISTIASVTATELLLTLEELSADELSSCTQNGIVLTGGIAGTSGVATYLSSIVHMPVYPASDPSLAAIRGTVTLMRELSEKYP
jgi:actin-like ATPase involved in cell morphogenesis